LIGPQGVEWRKKYHYGSRTIEAAGTKIFLLIVRDNFLVEDRAVGVNNFQGIEQQRLNSNKGT